MTRQPGNRSASEIAADANRCLRELEQATRPDASAGRSPADCYDVLGHLRMISEQLDLTASNVASWLEQQFLDGHLTVDGDPFTSEPMIAVGRLLDGLERAHLTWLVLTRALSDAQIASAGMASTRP